MILHDLGGPMTVLSNYAELLEEHEEAPPDIRHMAGEMREASAKAMTMLRSVLDFARGAASCTLRRQSLSLLVRAVIGQQVAELGKRLIHVDMDLQFRGEVLADGRRMDRVLSNLLGNAVDAMPNGGELRVATRDTGHGTVRLTLSDTGVGVPPEWLDRIFEPFVTHGKDKGTGLGLAIVKQIVDQHGGDVTCDSEPGLGTTFTITLPVAVASDGDQ
jgi:signal transduction histidine kinase